MVCSDEISYVGEATGKLLTQGVQTLKRKCIIALLYI